MGIFANGNRKPLPFLPGFPLFNPFEHGRLDVIEVLLAGLDTVAALFADQGGNLGLAPSVPADDEGDFRKRIGGTEWFL